MSVLLTGGAGFIGSHTAVELLEAGYSVVVVDNLRNSSKKVVDRLEEITGQTIPFYEVDVSDQLLIEDICRSEDIDAAVHFAGLKAVAESVADPLDYYGTNLTSTISLAKALRECGITRLVFSSSATVYGEPDHVPMSEQSKVTVAANPYGQSKIMIEQMLKHLSEADPDMSIALLRYFNPAGAHPSARIGEDPKGIPNNLVPYLTQVAIGKRDQLTINGDDYPTADGTCIRDYIHVCDLAKGHVAALRKLERDTGVFTYNLGTGRGQSVKEVVTAFERATNQSLSKVIGPRRPGDIAESYTDPTLAATELDWSATLTIEDICRDAWLWQQENPNGYEED